MKVKKLHREIVAYDDNGSPIFGVLVTTGAPKKKSKRVAKPKKKLTPAEFRRKALADVGIYWG